MNWYDAEKEIALREMIRARENPPSPYSVVAAKLLWQRLARKARYITTTEPRSNLVR